MAIQYNGTTIGTLTLCQARREKNSDGDLGIEGVDSENAARDYVTYFLEG